MISALFDIAPFEICGRPADDGASVDLRARNADGGRAMRATVTLASESVR